MPPVGFEPKISAVERQQTYALDRVATGTGDFKCVIFFNTFTTMLCTEVGGTRSVKDKCRAERTDWCIQMWQAGLLQEIYCVFSNNSKRQVNGRLYKNAVSAVALVLSSIIWDDDGVQKKRNECGRSGSGVFQWIVWIFGWMNYSKLFTAMKRNGRVHTVRTCLNSIINLECRRVKTANLHGICSGVAFGYADLRPRIVRGG